MIDITEELRGVSKKVEASFLKDLEHNKTELIKELRDGGVPDHDIQTVGNALLIIRDWGLKKIRSSLESTLIPNKH